MSRGRLPLCAVLSSVCLSALAVCGLLVCPSSALAQEQTPPPTLVRGPFLGESPRLDAPGAAPRQPQVGPSLATPIAATAASFGVSPKLSDTPEPGTGGVPAALSRVANSSSPGDGRVVEPAVVTISDGVDGAMRTAVSQASIAAPGISFDGVSNADNLSVVLSRLSPPDPVGDVGPNHYVQAVNGVVRVFDKSTGGSLKRFDTRSLFSYPCSSTLRYGRIVQYDQLADRWIIGHLSDDPTTSTGAPYHICLAVSQTPDPTGAYYRYDFVVANAEAPALPHFGVWPDGYYLSVHQLLNNTTEDGNGAYAFDRAKMLAGDPTAGMVYFNLHPPNFGAGFPLLAPSDLDGLVLPPAGRANTFAAPAASEWGYAYDALYLFDFHVDFATPANSTFTNRPESPGNAPLAVAAFDPTNPPVGDIRQPAPATDAAALSAFSGLLTSRMQYRSNGSVESLVLSHSVGAPASTVLGTYRSGVRYYQLTRTIAGGLFGVLDQGTYAPADGVSRWLPAAATDNTGNLAVGFAAASASVYPSLRYAGRLATDPAGTLAQGENTLVAGSGVQTTTTYLYYGRTSSLTLDPTDDCTFWQTGEYYSSASQASDPSTGIGWTTRVGSFAFPQCTPAGGGLQGTITNLPAASAVSGASIQVSNGFATMSAGNGSYALRLAPGTYTLTVSLAGYVTQVVPGVVVTGGAAATLNVALVPIPQITAGATALIAESFVPANGGIEPGETVSVNFTLNNVATRPGATTVNLTATLLPTGGVLDPSAPVSYGGIAPAGSGTQAFAFRASPVLACAAPLTATLQLSDGANPLNTTTIPFTFTLGANAYGALQNFDGVAAPALPAGWTAANASGPAPLWVTTTSTPDAGTNAAFVDNPAVTSDKRLDSAAFTPTAGATVSFRHRYLTENNYDGGVLEIAIGAGAFTDIISAGGSWVTGGYNKASLNSGNPLAGRAAWSGDSGDYITTTVSLPPSAAGQSVKLRFRLGSDGSVGGTGWWIDSLALSSRTCTPVPVLNVNGSALTAESFLPANGAVDPGELVTVDLGLRNVGTGPSANLTVALLTSADILAPSGPVAYGAVPVNGTTTKALSFRANPLRSCALPLAATVQLSDGAVNLGSLTFTLPVAGSVPPYGDQDFDAYTAPAMPSDWVATNALGSAPLWRTTTVTPDDGPNAAYVDDPATVADKRMTWTYSRAMPVGVRFVFRNKFDLEATYDGAVLEMSINNGPFVDIVSAGGTVVSGGYTSVISSNFSNPLGGRLAWTGNSGGYVTTAIDLPASTVGQSVTFRWRMGSDSSYGAGGWWVDEFRLERTCAPGAGEVTQNGGFSSGADGTDHWLKFATPDLSYMPWNVTNGVFQFYRATGGTQAVVFQQTGVPVPTVTPIDVAFDLGNSMGVRRRVSVLVHDSDFSDLSVCTFWLPPNLPLSTYHMHTHTTKAWTDATVSFYAASVGQDSGGFYRLDNVSVRSIDGSSTVQTDCVDPMVTAASGTTSGELLTNGAFDGGTIAPWGTFGNLSWQLAGGEFNFFKLPGAPAGVVLQGSGASAVTNQRMLVTFQAGNSSAVRQRMTVLLHDANFSDLSACTFWLPPGTPLATYGLRTYATQPWTSATVSVYPATAGSSPTSEWLRLDNVSLTKVTSTITGTECLEPGSAP